MKKGFIVILVGLLLAVLCLTFVACHDDEEEGVREVEIVLYDPYDYSVIESGDVVQVPVEGTALGIAIRDARTGRSLTVSDIPQPPAADTVSGEESGESSDVRELTPTDCLYMDVQRYESEDGWCSFWGVAGQECAAAEGGIFPYAQWPAEEGVYKFIFTFDCYRNVAPPYNEEDREWTSKEVSYVLRLTEDRTNGPELPVTYDMDHSAREVYALPGETVPLVFDPEFSADYTFTAIGADVEFMCDGGVAGHSADGATLKVRGKNNESLHIECKNLTDEPAVFKIMIDITPPVLNVGDEITFTIGEDCEEVVEVSVEQYTMINWYVTGEDVGVHHYRDWMDYDYKYGASGTDPHGYIYNDLQDSRRFLVLRADEGTEVTVRVDEPPVIEFGKEYTLDVKAARGDDIYDTAYSVIHPYNNLVRFNLTVEEGSVVIGLYDRIGTTSSTGEYDPDYIRVLEDTYFSGEEVAKFIYGRPGKSSYMVVSPSLVSKITYSAYVEITQLGLKTNYIGESTLQLYRFSPRVTMHYTMAWENIDKVSVYDANGNEIPASFIGVGGETYYILVEDAGENAALKLSYTELKILDMAATMTGVMGDEGFVCARFVAPESCRYSFVDSGVDRVTIVKTPWMEQGYAGWAELDAGQEVIFKLYGTPGEEYSFGLEIKYFSIRIDSPQNVYEGMYSFEIKEAGSYEVYANSYSPENVSLTLITPEGDEIIVAATAERPVFEFAPGVYIIKVTGDGSATVRVSPAQTV